MSTIAIGDVHGDLAALNSLLDRIAPEVGAEDTVVFLGDYLDRGPDSKGCIQRIIEFRRTAKGRVATLLGNHEQWMLRTHADHTRHSWLLGMDALRTIQSYSAQAAAKIRVAAETAGPRLVTERLSLPYEMFFAVVPEEHMNFFKSLQPFCRTPDAVCVHGGVDPDGARVEEQRAEDLIWGTDGFPERYQGADFVLYGHANNSILDEHGWPHPRMMGRTCGLDTISNGVLTALRLPERTVFQSDRHA